MADIHWALGMAVEVAPRTWPGINKPGGVGKIVKLHVSSLGIVDGLDVKYVLGNNTDTNLEPDLVKPHAQLARGRRSRKGRDIFTVEATSAERTAAAAAAADTAHVNSVTDTDEAEAQPAKKPKRRTRTRNAATTKVTAEVEKENQPDCNGDISNKQETSKANNNQIKCNTKKKRGQEETNDCIASKKKKKSTTVTKKAAKPAATKTKKPKVTTNKPSTDEITTTTAAAINMTPAAQDRPADPVPSVIVTEHVTAVTPLSPLAGNIRDPASAVPPQCTDTSKHANASTATTSSTAAACQSNTNEVAPPLNQAQASLDVEGPTSLQNVYQVQISDANNYIHDIVGVPKKAKAADKPPSKPRRRKKKSPPQQPPAEETAEQRRLGRRWQLFSEYFAIAMSRNDMSLPEEHVFESINECVHSDRKCKPFTAEEVVHYVSKLCSEEKIMKSAGSYYEI